MAISLPQEAGVMMMQVAPVAMMTQGAPVETQDAASWKFGIGEMVPEGFSKKYSRISEPFSSVRMENTF